MIQISDARGLSEIFSGGTYELTKDITCDSSFATLQGMKSVTIDGKGHRISGLVAPLFGNLAFSKISNVTVECDIYEPTIEYVGAVARLALQVTFSNVTINGHVAGGRSVGGICGDLTQSTVEDCENRAELSGENYVGGLFGLVAHSSVKYCKNRGAIVPLSRGVFAGGIMGLAEDEAFICDNVNEGAIMGGKFHCVGGIAGGANAIRVFQGNINRGLVRGQKYVGGIVGVAEKSAILRNENLVPIEATGSYVGGIAGYLAREPLYVSENVSAGAITASKQYAGGVAGCANVGCVITHNVVTCTYVKADEYVARVLGFAQGEVYLRNDKVFAGMTLSGISRGGKAYADQIVFPDDEDLGEGGLMGASLIPPIGFKAVGARMYLDAEEQVSEEPLNETTMKVEALSSSYAQVVSSLIIGASSLATMFQVDQSIVKQMLPKHPDMLPALRTAHHTIGEYLFYLEYMFSEAAKEGINGGVGEPAEQQPRHIVLRVESEATGQPLQGSRLKVAYGESSTEHVSDVEGRVALDGVLNGEYIITEVAPPFGYLRDDTPRKLVIDDNGVYLDGFFAGNVVNDLNISRDGVVVLLTRKRDESALYIACEQIAARPESTKYGIQANYGHILQGELR